MGKKSDDKGQRGERAAAENLRNFYFADDAERAPRKDRWDVCGPEGRDAETIQGVGAHVEVKSFEKHAAYKFVEQAVEQKISRDWPLVMLHANYKPNWLYVIRDVDILDFVRGYLTNRARQWPKRELKSETTPSSLRGSSSSPFKPGSSGDTLLSEELVAQRFEEWNAILSSSRTSTPSTGSADQSETRTEPGAESGLTAVPRDASRTSEDSGRSVG